MVRTNRIGGDRDPFADDNEDVTPSAVTPQAAASNAYGLSVNARKPNLGAVDRQRTKFTLTPSGIEIAENVTASEIITQVRAIDNVKRADFWYLGDLMARAEDNEWNEVFVETERITNIPRKTLEIYAWLCRAVLLTLRGVNGVQLTHYKLIAKCKPKEQEQWVQRVVDNDWSTRQLDAAIKGNVIPATPPPGKKRPAKMSAQAETTEKLAKFESGVGGFRSRDDARKAIADLRRWLDDLERGLR